MTPDYMLDRARERERILIVLARGLDDPRRTIDIVTASDTETARARLMEEYGVDVIGATAILDMQLRRFNDEAKARVHAELGGVRREIAELAARVARGS